MGYEPERGDIIWLDFDPLDVLARIQALIFA